MWLLDVNVPRKLALYLAEFGISARHTDAHGWGELTNGDLVEAAVANGFSCLVTRDRLFGESASRALKRFPEFAVVLLVIPQLREAEFLAKFRDAWVAGPIHPLPGQLVRWP